MNSKQKKYKPLTAAQRKRRKEIRFHIVKGREIAKRFRLLNYTETARTLEALAGIAEKYLKIATNQPDE